MLLLLQSPVLYIAPARVQYIRPVITAIDDDEEMLAAWFMFMVRYYE